MSNPFKTAITAAFNNVWLPSIGGGVDVKNGELICKGIRDTEKDLEFLQEMNAATTGFVKVLADEIGEVKTDGEVSVDGKRVIVTAVNTDAAGAVTRIDYAETRSVPQEFM